MLRCAIFVLLLLVSSVVSAGEAEVHKSFVVATSPKNLATWVQQNADAVAESTGCQLVSREGDKVRLRKRTPKGTFEFTLREVLKVGDTGGGYSTTLVEVHQGPLQEQTTIAKVEDSNGKAKVTIYMKAKVGGRVMDVDVRLGLNKSLRGFQDLLENNFR